MSDYKQVDETVDVPMDSGVEGFLLAIRHILTLPRVVEVRIHGKGKVTYKRWVRDEDDANANLRIDFESVTPLGVVRNNDIIDVGIADPNGSPPAIMCRLLNRAQSDHMYPTAIVISSNSVFFDWFQQSGIDLPRSTERFFGHRLLRDRFVEDSTLLLCTAYGPSGTLIDTRITYKLSLPAREAPVRYLPGVDDEDLGGSSKSGADRPADAVGAPEMGSAGTRPGGRVATIPISEISGGGGTGNRPGAGRAGPGSRT